MPFQDAAVEIETGTRPDAAVIWLHGLGADGHDFESIVPQLQLPNTLAVRFVFPHAPVRPVTLNMGMRMRAWYDIVALGQQREDEPGIRASQALVEELVAAEKARGISAARIVLAGFSQGGAVALQTALRHREALAGILALSTYLPLASRLPGERAAQNDAVPIFMAHGTQDPLIDIAIARRSRDGLRALGYRVEWHEYPMPHAVCAPEIDDIARWLSALL